MFEIFWAGFQQQSVPVNLTFFLDPSTVLLVFSCFLQDIHCSQLRARAKAQQSLKELARKKNSHMATYLYKGRCFPVFCFLFFFPGGWDVGQAEEKEKLASFWVKSL